MGESAGPWFVPDAWVLVGIAPVVGDAPGDAMTVGDGLAPTVAAVVGDGETVRVAVGEGAGVVVGLVGEGDGVLVSVGEGVFVTVGEGVSVTVGEGVLVTVGEGVLVSVGEGVLVSVGKGVPVSSGMRAAEEPFPALALAGIVEKMMYSRQKQTSTSASAPTIKTLHPL